MELTTLTDFEHEAELRRQTLSVRDKVQTHGPENFEYLYVDVVVVFDHVTSINYLQQKLATSCKYTDGRLFNQ